MPSFPETVIYLTRHGEGEHNLHPHIIQGRAPEAKLTARGKRQARQLGERLAAEHAPDVVVCSSLPRTLETATIAAAKLGGLAVHGEDAFWDLSKKQHQVLIVLYC